MLFGGALGLGLAELAGWLDMWKQLENLVRPQSRWGREAKRSLSLMGLMRAPFSQ